MGEAVFFRWIRSSCRAFRYVVVTWQAVYIVDYGKKVRLKFSSASFLWVRAILRKKKYSFFSGKIEIVTVLWYDKDK